MPHEPVRRLELLARPPQPAATVCCGMLSRPTTSSRSDRNGIEARALGTDVAGGSVVRARRQGHLRPRHPRARPAGAAALRRPSYSSARKQHLERGRRRLRLPRRHWPASPSAAEPVQLANSERLVTDGPHGPGSGTDVAPFRPSRHVHNQRHRSALCQRLSSWLHDHEELLPRVLNDGPTRDARSLPGQARGHFSIHER